MQKHDKDNQRYVLTCLLGEIKWTMMLSWGYEMSQVLDVRKNNKVEFGIKEQSFTGYFFCLSINTEL